jgi:DNA polymerase-4
MHVDLDAFYASVEQLLNSALKGKPVIISSDSRRGVVSTASYEARQYGVHSAMTLAQAKQLCPEGIYLPGDFKSYKAYSKLFFEVLQRHTPTIESLSLDEAFLDLSGNHQARKDPVGLAQEIKEQILEHTNGLIASIGIGNCKVVAKVASDYEKPNGLTYVKPGTEAAFLAPLPIRALPGIGPATETKLQAFGIKTVGEIASLPPNLLGNRGNELILLSRGIDSREVIVSGAPKSISRETTFEYDVIDPQYLKTIARRLTQEVTQSLREEKIYSKTVVLKFRFAGFETHTSQSTFLNPTDSDIEFLGAMEVLLKNVIAKQRPLRLIGVGATNLTDIIQEELFATSDPKQKVLDQKLDSIRKRFGQEAISRGMPSHAPQNDFRKLDIPKIGEL